jgi:hypothetical protein
MKEPKMPLLSSKDSEPSKTSKKLSQIKISELELAKPEERNSE